MRLVYIVLVNWNGWRDTIECLESLFRNSYQSYRVIVCDNNSSDNSLENIKTWAENGLVPAAGNLQQLSWPPVTKPISYVEYDRMDAEKGGCPEVDHPLVLIRTGGNLGFAGGNNVGLRYALARGDFDYVWLLNNDTVIDSNALTALVQRMETKPAAGMCGSTIYYYEKPDKIQALGGGWYCKWIGLPWHYGRFGRHAGPINPGRAEAWMNYVEGASLLISRDFLQQIGLMCEDYFLFFEEADWAIRAKGRFLLTYAAESIVYHKVGSSIGTSSNPREKSYTCDYYNIRNRLYFTAKYYPYALLSVCMLLAFTFATRVLLFKWDRVAMILKIIYDFVATGFRLRASACGLEKGDT